MRFASLSFLVLAFISPLLAETDVTRATLDNGLRVVVVKDPLAPVATLEENYLAGADDTPPEFPGTAHAQEHMTFRGCQGLSSDQIAAIYAQLGGDMNAETGQTTTQYFVTLPSQDLDVALRLDAACMSGVQDSEDQWKQERGAIEQEVSRDLSSPTAQLFMRVRKDLFVGTPYERDGLGTTPSFDKTTAADLKRFHDRWYVPNNAVLVVTGNLDAAATIDKIKAYYGAIPRKPVPAHPAIDLKPVKNETFTLDSDLPYTLVSLSFRLPGSDAKDFAAAHVLADVLGSARADLYGMVPAGKALGAGFQIVESHPAASAAFAYAAIPPGADPMPTVQELRQILYKYRDNGVPADLVKASIEGEISGAEFSRNSISNLAALWSQVLADEGRQSPDQDVEAIRKVTVEDVNRLAKEVLQDDDSVVGILKPKPSGEPVEAKGFGGSEKTTSAPTKPVQLPNWAEAAVKSLRVPQLSNKPSDVTLPNGIRLIVQTERTSPTITVVGSVKTQIDMETPPDKEGVDDILEALFPYGTKSMDRLSFQKAVDDIAAAENAGASFNLKVLKQYFDRGVQLLADNELHPALPQSEFEITKQQTEQAAAGELQSPSYHFEKALAKAMLPGNDPLLRETTPKTVGNVTYSDVTAFYNKVIRPDLTTIVVIGDISPDDARRTIEKYFGEWKTTDPKPNVVLPPVPVNNASAVNVPDPSQVQDSVTLAEQLGINRFSPDYYPLQLGNHVLGGGFYATRLYRDVRQQAGYVYFIENSMQAGETRSEFSVEYGCDPKNVSKARALIQQDLTEMQNTPVSPAELQQAKALLLRQIPLGQSSEDDVAALYVARARLGLPLDESITAAQRYFNMTADEVQAAFKKWIDPSRLVQVVRGPAPQ